MIVDARTADVSDRFRPYTVKAALWAAIGNLSSGHSVVIDAAYDVNGAEVSRSSLAAMVSSIGGPGRFAVRKSDTGLMIVMGLRGDATDPDDEAPQYFTEEV